MKPLTPSSSIDLAAIREKLRNLSGKKYWRSLEEVAGTNEFKEFLHREFPDNASEFLDEVGRREFLKLMAASLALAGLTACTRQPLQEIVPYVNQPEELVLGTPLYYATAMPHNGFAHGLLVTSWEGHPTKIEGNADHPISLGATNVFMQGALLDLYDPDRSQAITHGLDVSTWDNFLSMTHQALLVQKSKRGAGLRILTETITSPTLISQLKTLLNQFPAARWVQYQPINRDNVYEGARLIFGEPVETHYNFDRAEVILSLDSDFLFTHPASLRYARQFSDGRRVSAGQTTMNRLYAIETTPTITGAMADHRWPAHPSEIENIAKTLSEKVGLALVGLAVPSEPGPNNSNPPANSPSTSPIPPNEISALIADLQTHRGSSIIIAGDEQPPVIHALAHAMNDALGNFGKTVSFTAPVSDPGHQLHSLRQLTGEMSYGEVDLLLILGGNPAFTAPADLEFAKHLAAVPQSIHLSLHADETSASCKWHLPETHFLETWSDARAFDGTCSILQPLINPLYNGVAAHELVAAFLQTPVPSAYDIVREHWRSQYLWPDFEAGWRTAIHNGTISNFALPPKLVAADVRRLKFLQEKMASPTFSNISVEIIFRPDPTLWDGRFANNGWLQELAKPITKVSWDNPALISPALAEQYQLNNGDIVELRHTAQSLRIPVWITPGHADRCITLHLGSGRDISGRVGTDVGFNSYKLRTTQTFWSGRGVELVKTGQTHLLVSTQIQHNVHSPERQILRDGTFAEFQRDPAFVQPTVEKPPIDQTLYNVGEHKYDGYKWAMSIDLTTCIGCNACVLGCQSENNIPIVGKSQVGNGRAMQWIRIDSYFHGALENPAISHMPVPCMQCENAPCELVCPVAATLHDHEGLNLQVYNRCVGTRFCSNNCPYKVRRFNFFSYADYFTRSLKPMRNPEVTVRWRGVMEKCTYCIQRISAVRIASEKEDRRIRDGEIVPACAQACPTRAIVFGDISDPNSRVSKLRKHPLNYDMLGELNTRPRTTYLTKLTNPNPAINGT